MTFWTQEMTRVVVAKRNEGWTYQAIADYIGVSYDAVRTQCLNSPLVLQKPRNCTAVWHDDLVNELIRHFNEGLTTNQIADALGKTPSSVRGIQRRLGLRRYIKVPDWTQEEDEGLMQLLDLSSMCLVELARYWRINYQRNGWHPRTHKAIQFRAMKLGCSFDLKDRGHCTTIPELASILKVSNSVVERWYRNGDLPAIHRDTENPKRHIHLRDFVGFVLDNYGEVAEVVKPPQFYWILSLISDYCVLKRKPRVGFGNPKEQPTL